MSAEVIVDAEIVEDQEVFTNQRDFTAEEAREHTDHLRFSLKQVWDDITEAYVRGAHRALGYASWDEYCQTEFGEARIRLPREERAEAVRSLRESGLSLRAISSATGADVKTVRSDLARVGTSHTSTLGTDGKVYEYVVPEDQTLWFSRSAPGQGDPLTPEERAQRFHETKKRLISEGLLPPERTQEEKDAAAERFLQDLLGGKAGRTAPRIDPKVVEAVENADRFTKALNEVGAAIRQNATPKADLLDDDGAAVYDRLMGNRR